MEMGNRNTDNIKIVDDNANLCGTKYAICAFDEVNNAAISEICGNRILG